MYLEFDKTTKLTFQTVNFTFYVRKPPTNFGFQQPKNGPNYAFKRTQISNF